MIVAARPLAAVGAGPDALYPWPAAMIYRSSRRWLAPAALATAAAAVVATVTSGGNADGAARPEQASEVAMRPSKPTMYTVKPGDALSTIAASTGVSLARIERLNPAVDAKALHAGQQIKLAP